MIFDFSSNWIKYLFAFSFEVFKNFIAVDQLLHSLPIEEREQNFVQTIISLSLW